jgi:hypothetical protein
VILQIHICSAERAVVTNEFVDHLPCAARLCGPPGGFLSLAVSGAALFLFLLLLKETVLFASLLRRGQEAGERGLLDGRLGLLWGGLGRRLLGWGLDQCLESELELEIVENNELELLPNRGASPKLEARRGDAVQAVVQSQLEPSSFVYHC